MAQATNCEAIQRGDTSLATRSQRNWSIGWYCPGGLDWSRSAALAERYPAEANCCKRVQSGHFLPAGGGGLRFELSKKYHVNLRADIAQGRDGHTFGMGVGEAF